MVSATQIPPAPPLPPRPPQPPQQSRSFAGPIVLIVLGIFFLLGNLGMIAWHDLGRWFAHYWPVLLILWGVIKLIEYQSANRAGGRARGIGAGGILLVIFLVAAGLIATQANRMNWQEVRDQMHIEGDIAPWWGHTYTYTDDLQQSFPAAASLQVVNERGAVNVSESNDNQIHITAHKRVNADRQEEAEKWNKSTRPRISANGSVVLVDANTWGAGDHWISSDLDISVPRKASLVVSTRRGDISVMGRDGSAELTNRHGDISVTDLSGNLALSLDHSSARVSGIGSDVSIQGRANDVSLEDIKGGVRLDGDFMESVKFARIAKSVSFKSSRTELDFVKLDGYLNLDSGDLEASSVTGPLRLRTRSKDVMINGSTSDVHLQNENGAVEVHINKLGNLDVSNAKGDIRIFLPEKSAFQVDAQASDGQIETDFSDLKVENGDNRATARGSVGGGGPHMLLKNEHGTIEIRRGVAIPPSPPMPNMPKIPKMPSIPHPTEN